MKTSLNAPRSGNRRGHHINTKVLLMRIEQTAVMIARKI
jgi:hypothetical protein